MEVKGMTTPVISRTIDARGLPSPRPLMCLIGAIQECEVGDLIEVLSSDSGSRTDITAWLRRAGHELVEVVEDDGFARIVVGKAR